MHRYQLSYQSGRRHVTEIIIASSDDNAAKQARCKTYVSGTMTISRWDDRYVGWLPITVTDIPENGQYRITLASMDGRISSLELTVFKDDATAQQYAENAAAMIAARHQQRFISRVSRYNRDTRNWTALD